MSEANARIAIDKLLRESGWVLPGDDGNVNVETEMRNGGGFADYVLKDGSDFPLCIIEAKKKLLSPLVGKEQARRYAEELRCRFVILSNGVSHYLWDIEQGSPQPRDIFPSPQELELTKTDFNPPREEFESIDEYYIARTQLPEFDRNPDFLDQRKRGDFLRNNKLRLLRDYQLKAVRAVRSGIAAGKNRFLLEMATGTGKTLTSAAIIKMFLRLYNVKRVLFLVDRIELERQAQQELDRLLKNDFKTVVWKENRSDWTKGEIVVSTVQSFLHRNKYRKLFRPNHFGLVISDEAHRSLGGKSRKVFEYFIGFKLGLTATPKDYLKSVDIEAIAETDPRRLERRSILDTYTAFGCDGGKPTFRYSLEEGVKGGYLINPKVIDARTEITTELLSKEGYPFQRVDDDGNDVEETFTRKDFEKKFFSDNTNTVFCETFLEHALRDPYTGEIGKTLVFCVSQNHAAKVTSILNRLAARRFPKKYDSDFAVQVTSNVQDPQRMTTKFSDNKLNDWSKFNPHYRTSKTRVCVTVGMMTTGYDCADILNICMIRPVYSPSEFIQMKGRGTRTHDFSSPPSWITESEIPDRIEPRKKEFLLFDFFGNYDYFEKDFDYDQVLKLPSNPSEPLEPTGDPSTIDKVVSTAPDSPAELKEILISERGMKIDRDLYRSFKKKVAADEKVKELVSRQDFDRAESYLQAHVLDKPEEFFTIDKLGKSLGLDRRLTVPELLLYVFGHINRIPDLKECLDQEFDKLDEALKPADPVYDAAREVFEAYVLNNDCRNVIDSKKYGELRFLSSGDLFDSFKKLPPELKQGIPSYIKRNVNLQRLESVRH
ncbi:MAG: DEAD/DEAH box helicase family protein [Chlamydiota bacterium]